MDIYRTSNWIVEFWGVQCWSVECQTKRVGFGGAVSLESIVTNNFQKIFHDHVGKLLMVKDKVMGLDETNKPDNVVKNVVYITLFFDGIY